MKKYNIDDFYIGQLCFSHNYGNEYTKLREQRTVSKGAIDFQKSFMNDDSFDRILTIFYKKNVNEYICIHNGEKFSFEGEVFCDKLVPIRDLMPKIGFIYKDVISFKEAIMLFYHLFQSNFDFYSNSSSVYDIHNFYLGNLNLISSSFNKKNHEYSYRNVPESYLSFYSDALLLGGLTQSSKRFEYNFETYRCLFLKTKHNKLYNVNNFQNYHYGLFRDLDYYNPRMGNSFYDNIIPLTKEAECLNIKVRDKHLSLSRALNLQKRINKAYKPGNL